ncbi:ESCRT-II complex, vps25 subunit [Aspergillus heterothallicus]
MINTMDPASSSTVPFTFPLRYKFPPFFSLQPNSNTHAEQLKRWSNLIQSWCRHHRIFRISLVDAVESPLFRNAELHKQLSLKDARVVLDWMSKGDEEGGGGKRAEWIDGVNKGAAWIWWKRPEEWAGVIADWVDYTGQKNVVLTVYELLEGEATASQEWHGMDAEVMFKSLNVLVKQGKAQVFGSEGQEGVKFF